MPSYIPCTPAPPCPTTTPAPTPEPCPTTATSTTCPERVCPPPPECPECTLNVNGNLSLSAFETALDEKEERIDADLLFTSPNVTNTESNVTVDENDDDEEEEQLQVIKLFKSIFSLCKKHAFYSP